MENKFILKLGGRDLTVEVNKLAEQANGSALVQYGDTVLLATATMSRQEREGIDFFPLMVDYEEKFYAAGKILGARYTRREARPTDEAVLTARLIDRAIRPLFPKGLRKDIQVIITCLSWDKENDPDILGLIAASCALTVSDIPWNGPVSAIRIGKIGQEEKFILNPTQKQKGKENPKPTDLIDANQIDLDLTLAGVKSENANREDVLINMIEAKANQTQESTVLNAVKFAKPELKKILEFQDEIREKAGKAKFAINEPIPEPELEREIKEFLGDQLENAIYPNSTSKKPSKSTDKMNELTAELCYFIEGKYPGMGKTKFAKNFLEEKIESCIHRNILESEKRPDGRKLDEIRKISGEIGLLPRVHGSSLFSRGVTKALSILTLGAPGDQRLIEGMEVRGKKRFMHHYNFTPYSVGETRPLRGPARRDIGHGMLAEKTLTPLLPSFEDFPYTMRIVTEIVSSNGSTSMASVSSASLALMEAGVPIKAPAAGIAIGLIMADNGVDYKILNDIQGPEDHYGDMDFKVAGTKKGITAIQMDVKTLGISEKIFGEALTQGKKVRTEILDKIEKIIPEPRKKLSPFAPRILTHQISPDKIRDVIGPGGKMINEIIDACDVSIDIEDSGSVYITSLEGGEAAEKALNWIKSITREVVAGEIFQGTVKRIMDFGAFVEILPKQEGLVHISQLAERRVEKVKDIVKIGDTVSVKVTGIDEQGRINLSMKDAKK